VNGSTTGTFAGRLAAAAAALLLASPCVAGAETITLPAAASIQGVAPFYSDVRVFNTSYASPIAVTATYRCFLGPCPASPPQLTVDLAPRQSRAFDDMVASAFGQPNTAGGVEFTFDGEAKSVVVTSRLYSTFPRPTVGMFIPGLDASEAATFAALTSVRTRGPGAGFRTNVGVFNPGDSAATVRFTLFADGARVGGVVQRRVEAHSGRQVNAIFVEAGASAAQTSNGVVLVESDAPVFSYAAVIDNATSDPYLVTGSPDAAPAPPPSPTASVPPTRTGSATATPTGGGGTTPTVSTTATLSATVTPSPTPTGPTPTPSNTFTASQTFTPSITFTASRTFTPSLTPTITPTFTRTNTFTRTSSATRTFTASPTGSATATFTATRTFSPTQTGTATFTPSPTPSPTPSVTATATRTLTPTLTPTPNPNHIVFVGQGGTQFVDSISGTSTTTINAGQTVEWQWVGNNHSTTSGTCTPGGCTAGPPCPLCTPWDSGVRNIGDPSFTQTFTSSNTYTYFCTQHGFMMQGTIVVNP
jgi:plastocyanin